MNIDIKNDLFSQQTPDATDDSPNKKSPYSYLPFVLYALGGFCFSQLNALGDMSPFTVSFLSAIKFDYCFPAFIASSVGYFLSMQWQGALKYIAISFIMCIIRLFLSRRGTSDIAARVSYIGCFACVFTVSLGFSALSDLSYTGVFTAICEGCLSLCASVFFIRSLRTPVMKTGISALGIKDSLSLVLSLCIFLMCMSGFDIEGLSPARMLSCLFIMFISFYKGSTAGSIAGICIGAALSVGPDSARLFSSYALSGLITGVFSPLGQIVTALSFAVSYSAVSLFQGSGSQVLIGLIEAAIASAAFMILPSEGIDRLCELLKKSGITPDNPVYRQVSGNLLRAADNIYEVSDIVTKVSEKLDSIINPEVNRLFANLQQSVCADCESKSLCWNKMFDSTARDILALCGIEKRTKGRLPLEKRCSRKDVLLPQIKSTAGEYASNMAAKMKSREMRRVLTDQFNCMGDFFKETADRLAGSKIIDTPKSTALRSALQDAGIYTDALSYYYNGDGRVTIEISIIDKPFEADRKKLRHIIEFICKRRFGEADITVGDVKTTISFEEKQLYSIHFGYSKRPLEKNKPCGDSVCFVSAYDGSKAAIISDGMGTGPRAAMDSTLTCSVLEKLIEGGFSLPGAVRAVNSALIMKSTDESISTVDAVSINLYTGQADFCKAGAAVSFIRSGNEVCIIKESSLPLGIIRNISPARRRVQLTPGDIILMVSDGATAGDSSWINDELLSWSTNSMQDLALHITSLALLRSDESTRDDITAAAVKITKAK